MDTVKTDLSETTGLKTFPFTKMVRFEHTDKDNIPEAVYGLPEFYRDEIKKANSWQIPVVTQHRNPRDSPIIGRRRKRVLDGKAELRAGMTPNQRLHHPTCGES